MTKIRNRKISNKTKHVKKHDTHNPIISRKLGIQASTGQIMDDAIIAMNLHKGVKGFSTDIKYKKTTAGLDQSNRQHKQRLKTDEKYQQHIEARNSIIDTFKFPVKTKDPLLKRFLNVMNTTIDGLKMDVGLSRPKAIQNIYNSLYQMDLDGVRARLSVTKRRDLVQSLFDDFRHKLRQLGVDIGHVKVTYADSETAKRLDLSNTPNKSEDVVHIEGALQDTLEQTIKNEHDRTTDMANLQHKMKKVKIVMGVSISGIIAFAAALGVAVSMIKPEKAEKPIYDIGSIK